MTMDQESNKTPEHCIRCMFLKRTNTSPECTKYAPYKCIDVYKFCIEAQNIIVHER